MRKNGHITGKTGVNWYRVSKWRVRQRTGSGKCRTFSGGASFYDRSFCGKCVAESDLEMEWKQKTLASFYLIRSFAGKDISGGAYFLEVLRRRGGFFLLLFLCGFTIFGVPLTVAYMLFLGMETGMILALSVLEFGIYGGVAGAGLLMPQYLVYIPAYFYLAGIVYRQSYGIWKNYGLVPQKTGAYFRQGITVFLLYTGGILAESFLNPWIVEKVIKGLKFF